MAGGAGAAASAVVALLIGRPSREEVPLHETPARCRACIMGEKARQFVRENFLITRHMREYLTLMLIMSADNVDGVQIR